ncbi:hypothetical protein EO92_08245 [Methanosarcina sp. 2.H.A.1B.4]|nr:hypothetical protein EO92_08245 [Methanosarcina sp. 2.H.A.1B.4]KKH49024.1 hypothetical protein EO93_02830 [Methanosarcina sp. 1.H.A.2.2]
MTVKIKLRAIVRKGSSNEKNQCFLFSFNFLFASFHSLFFSLDFSSHFLFFLFAPLRFFCGF